MTARRHALPAGVLLLAGVLLYPNPVAADEPPPDDGGSAEAIALRGSLSGVVLLPPEAAPGETIVARIEDEDLVDAGGTWELGGGLSGVVVDPDDKDGEDGGTPIAAYARAPGDPVRDVGGGVLDSIPESKDGKDTPSDDVESETAPGDPVPDVGTPLEYPDRPETKTGTPSDEVESAADLGGTRHETAKSTIRNLKAVALLIEVPEDFTGGTIPVRYTDRDGRVLVDSEATIDSAPVLVDRPGDRIPRITGGTGISFAGGRACVCGRFPEPQHWSGLALDGEPLGMPLTATGRLVGLRLPTGAEPGPHEVAGQPSAGFSPADHWTVRVVRIDGSLDRTKLLRGGSTKMELRVVGTDEPVTLRIVNRTPQVIRIQGGDEQDAASSGGRHNTIVRQVRGVGRGDFDVSWTLPVDWCPCTGDGPGP